MKLWILLALTFAPVVAIAQDDAADSARLAQLPLKEMPSQTPGHALAVFMTGDGGWASLDRHIVDDLIAHGVSVIGLNSREYLEHAKSPDQVGRDIALVASHYMSKWDRDSLILAGYSRGADLAPFVASRLPAELRSHLTLIAMVGLSNRAGFEFHLIDLVASPHRKSDRPTLGEIEKMKGVKMICVYGQDEEDSGCRNAPPGLMELYPLPGDHHFNDQFTTLSDIVVNATRSP